MPCQEVSSYEESEVEVKSERSIEARRVLNEVKLEMQNGEGQRSERSVGAQKLLEEVKLEMKNNADMKKVVN